MAEPFVVETSRASAAEFHAADLLAAPRPTVTVCAPPEAALVLGSGQSFDVADGAACRRAGVDVVRRRSGGGVVLVEPAAMCWFDVVVPAQDPRFASVAGDVSASMRWLGRRLVAALDALGVTGASVHPGRMVETSWSRLVCFDGLGPGEVLVDGRKLVGMSQRRTRNGARFQCMVHTRWSPELLVTLLADPRPSAGHLAHVATVAVATAAALPGALATALTTS